MLKNLLEGLKAFVVQPADPTIKERRDPIRARCHLPVTVTEGAEARHAIVSDVSLDGLRLKLSSPLKGKKVSVSHPSQACEFEVDTIRCEVLWTRKRKFSRDVVVGLKFSDDPSIIERSWVQFVLRELGFDERAVYRKRQYIRAEANLAADVFDENGNRLAEATVVNLGLGGVLLSTGEKLEWDSWVRLEIGPYHKLPVLDLRGLILSRGTDPDRTACFVYSIRFHEPGDEQLQLLGKYVLLLLKESAGLFGR